MVLTEVGEYHLKQAKKCWMHAWMHVQMIVDLLDVGQGLQFPTLHFENRDTGIIPNLILPSAESNALNAQFEALLNDLGMNESL